MRPNVLACLLALAALTASPDVLAGAFEDGKAAFERGAPAEALAVWRPIAEAGDVDAQFWLGQMFDLGRGVSKDFAQAALWYRRAADQGHAVAQHNLANMYEMGEGVQRSDYSMIAAASWYRRAALQGYKPAQGNLGVLYASGRGVKRDYVEAYMWFLLAGADANRAALARKLSPQEVATAERRAHEWKPKPER